MSVIFETGYSPPSGDEPLTHARIAHANNWQTGGTASATTTDSDYFVDGPTNSLTYEKWKPTSSSSTWTYTFSGSASIDYCCIGAHTLGTVTATVTIQLLVGGTWETVASDSITVDSPIFAIFQTRTATAGRVVISGGIPELGVVKFGRALQMQRALYGGHSPLDYARQTVMRSNRSSNGEFLGRTRLRNTLSTSFAWDKLTRAWIDDNWKSFQKAIEEEPFFIAWRPITFLGEVGLCWSDQMPVPSAMGVLDLHQVTLQVTARGYD